jgi:hypothetical protein
VASGVLLRCVALGAGLLLFWFVLFLVAADTAYGIHSKLFDITKREFDLLNYYGMAVLKLAIFVAFLVPYVAIRLTLRALP